MGRDKGGRLIMACAWVVVVAGGGHHRPSASPARPVGQRNVTNAAPLLDSPLPHRVVTKWDGLAPLTHYPAQQQTSGLGLGRRWGEGAGASHTRKRMLR